MSLNQVGYGESIANEIDANELEPSQAHEATSENQAEIERIAFMTRMSTEEYDSKLWIADSGCSVHMLPNRALFNNYTEYATPEKIRLADNHIIYAMGQGEIEVGAGTLKNVSYVPELATNLFSFISADGNGIEFMGCATEIGFHKNNSYLFSAWKDGGAYLIDFKKTPEPMKKAVAATSLEDWHKRFAHAPANLVQEMITGGAVQGIRINEVDKEKCDDCAKNKCIRTSHPTRTSPKATKPGQLIHLDTVGPIKPHGINNEKFILFAKNEFSKFCFTVGSPAKSRIPEVTKQIINQIEYHTGTIPTYLTTDQGTEFTSERLNIFL